MLPSDVEEKLVELLAVIYAKIPWGKMKTSKNPHDIFNHRVRAASRRANLYEFVSKLCNYFGLQSLPLSAQALVDELRPYEEEILNALSREHIPLCVRAILRAKEIKKKKEDKDGEEV
uniref:Uncharacterized protein n=1 Tax=Thermocrinis ruber TaxID=75906 RepID=A0A7C5T0H4_9AQUI